MAGRENSDKIGRFYRDEISGRNYANPVVERPASYRACSIIRASAYPQREWSHSRHVQGSGGVSARNPAHTREEAISYQERNGP